MTDGVGGGAWGGEQVLQALRAELLRPGAVTDGFAGVGVVQDFAVVAGDGAAGAGPGATTAGLTVTFRWRQDPTTYAVSLPAPNGPAAQESLLGVWTGTPVDSVQQWVGEAIGWLTEELDTGLVRRARRTSREGVVHLDSRDSPDVRPAGYVVGQVHLGPGGDRGRHLARVGLDVRAPRRAIRRSTLLTWVHTYVDDARGEPVVGHAALTWAEPAPGRPGRLARLEVLQVVPGTPGAVAGALAFHGLRDAAEAGAGRAVTTLDDPALAELGFTGPGAAGERSLALAKLRRPDVRG